MGWDSGSNAWKKKFPLGFYKIIWNSFLLSILTDNHLFTHRERFGSNNQNIPWNKGRIFLSNRSLHFDNADNNALKI